MAAALADPLATEGLSDADMEGATPWDDDGFWNTSDVQDEPATDCPPDDPILVNLKQSLQDAKARHKHQLAAALQKAIQEFPTDPKPNSKADAVHNSSTEARKGLHELSGGALWLERTYHKHLEHISQQRSQLHKSVESRKTERTNTLEAMLEVYNIQTEGEEKQFKQFMHDIDLEFSRLETEEHNACKKCKFQMAQHDSAQANTAAQLATAA